MKHLALAALLFAAPAFAAQVPVPGKADPRIRMVDYNADDVVRVTGFPGYQMTIQFAPDERIENVAVGDSVTWQVTPNKKANLLFVKPLGSDGRTNMSVVTDARAYNFELIAKPATKVNQRELTFNLRFKYAQPAKPVQVAAPAPPPVLNFAYKAKGAKANVPLRVYDDGRSTYFHWAQGIVTPAIFTVGPDKRESLVNFTVKGDAIVVDRVAQQFVLRHGKNLTRLTNTAFKAPAAPAPQQLAAQR
jgi:type IV secretion system protein VirB9